MLTAITCLAMAVYYEARSESLDAQLAVAEVIINRKHHPAYPSTICGVVKDDRGPLAHDCQFSFWCDGKPERPNNKAAWETAQDVARAALRGDVLGHGATHYHAASVSPSWAAVYQPVGQIGAHVFYTDGRCILPICSIVPEKKPH
jgi:spore germination cell wall hydrolase CwlJ-like protein